MSFPLEKFRKITHIDRGIEFYIVFEDDFFALVDKDISIVRKEVVVPHQMSTRLKSIEGTSEIEICEYVHEKINERVFIGEGLE